MSVLVVGSIGIDNVKTQSDYRENILGGSASFAAVASSHLAVTSIIGAVGEDFPEEHLNLYKSRSVNTDGLAVIIGGKTFRWTGEYSKNMNERETLDVQLNVLENFDPEIPESLSSPNILLLANMSPEAQLKTIENCPNAKFIIADTMDLWINIANEKLLEVLKKIDLLVINDSEAQLLTKTDNLIKAGQEIQKLGPKFVIIKKGEHGAIIFGEEDDHKLAISAYPLENLVDPTGAGDCFVGGLSGVLGKYPFDEISLDRKSVV